MIGPVLIAATLGGAQFSPAPTDPPALFVHANTAYSEGEFGRATSLYERLIDLGWDNGHVWYNLGNSYLRTGDLGAAVAAYVRAQSLLPRDADVRANLAFARKSTKDAIEPRQSAAVVRTLFFWHFGLSLDELSKALVAANLLFWLLLAVRLYRRDSEILRWVIVTVLVLVLALGASFALRLALPTRVVVVQAAEIEVHSGTNRDTVVQFRLHAGTEAELLETRGGWLRISLTDGKQGWVELADVAALDL